MFTANVGIKQRNAYYNVITGVWKLPQLLQNEVNTLSNVRQLAIWHHYGTFVFENVFLSNSS